MTFLQVQYIPFAPAPSDHYPKYQVDEDEGNANVIPCIMHCLQVSVLHARGSVSIWRRKVGLFVLLLDRSIY